MCLGRLCSFVLMFRWRKMAHIFYSLFTAVTPWEWTQNTKVFCLLCPCSKMRLKVTICCLELWTMLLYTMNMIYIVSDRAFSLLSRSWNVYLTLLHRRLLSAEFGSVDEVYYCHHIHPKPNYCLCFHLKWNTFFFGFDLADTSAPEMTPSSSSGTLALNGTSVPFSICFIWLYLT